MKGIQTNNRLRTEEDSYQPDSPGKKRNRNPDWEVKMKLRYRNNLGAFCPQEKSGFTLLENPFQERVLVDKQSTLTGFILLEVLVSVIILAVGLVAVLGAFSTSSKIVTTSEKYQTALQLAEQKLYEISSTPVDDLRDYGHGGFGDKYPDYNWEYEIEDKDSEFYTDEAGILLEPETYREITVIVSYTEHGKTITPITLVTYDTSKLRYVL